MSISDIFLIAWATAATFYAFNQRSLQEKSRVIITAMLSDDTLYTRMKSDFAAWKEKVESK
jgi:hypothetical protein